MYQNQGGNIPYYYVGFLFSRLNSVELDHTEDIQLINVHIDIGNKRNQCIKRISNHRPPLDRRPAPCLTLN